MKLAISKQVLSNICRRDQSKKPNIDFRKMVQWVMIILIKCNIMWEAIVDYFDQI